MQKMTITTSAKKQVVDITALLNDLLMKNFYDNGVCFLNLMHTSCSITIADMDPGTENDYVAAFENMVPKLNYTHPHDPSHAGDHIMSAVIGTSLTIPVTSASLVLGAYQRTILVEFNGPKERQINVSFMPIKFSGS
jgi:secondary thiamine-phosphate synthase enzyme